MNIKRILCFFGEHERSRPVDFGLRSWKPDPKNQDWVIFNPPKMIYCKRCLKTLYFGPLPPEHPNCMCTIVDLDNCSLRNKAEGFKDWAKDD
jgi:hypothetical protein